MTNVKLATALPQGEANGAAVIGPELVSHPHRLRILMLIVDCPKVSIDTDKGESTAVVRARRAEVVLPKDLATAEKLMRRALESRSGQTVLPMELEDELHAAFEKFDPDADPDADTNPEPGKPADPE